VEAPPVPVFEEEVIRAQYSTWAGHYHDDQKQEGTFQQKSLVQIEYNKNTGEIVLLDHDGVVTKEDYQHLMRAVTGGSSTKSKQIMNGRDNNNMVIDLDNDNDIAGLTDVVPEDVTVGMTHFIDVDEIDPDQVIDAEGEEFAATGSSLETFHTYTIPQLRTETQTQLQQQEYHKLQHIQQHHHQQYHHQEPMSSAYPPPATNTIPEMVLPTETNSDAVPQCGGWGFNHRRSSFMN
jgi:hypothetical protein